MRESECFYFIYVTCISDADNKGDQRVVRREFCWLTDPQGPRLKQSFSEALHIEWNAVKFCGIKSPASINAVTYMIEIAEGVEWKDGVMTRYMSDMISSEYKTVFYGQNVSDLIINNLKPSHWYHLRLIIEYNGVKVMSNSVNVHTHKSTPTPPGQAKITVVPVRNSFDLTTDVPVRLEVLISWLPSIANGAEIERYQVHLKRFDQYGNLLVDDPPFISKKQMISSSGHFQKSISKLIKPSKQSNQWTGSPGRSEVQIRNSLQYRSSSPTRSNSPKRSSTESLFPSTAEVNQKRTANPATAWRIIYDNLNRNVKLGNPLPTDAVWWIRIRAKNSLGWSEFSELRIINQKTHPSLFEVNLYSMVTHSSAQMSSIQSNNNLSPPRSSSGRTGQASNHSDQLLPNIQPETGGVIVAPIENLHWGHQSDVRYSIPPEFQSHKQSLNQSSKGHQTQGDNYLPNINRK